MIYPILVFIETIESIQGIKFIRDAIEGAVKVKVYEGLNGKLVMIDMTEEDIEEDLGSIYLEQLGLSEYIEAMFPQERVQPLEAEDVIKEAKGGDSES